jgi:trehalose transport system substrate-binding protein
MIMISYTYRSSRMNRKAITRTTAAIAVVVIIAAAAVAYFYSYSLSVPQAQSPTTITFYEAVAPEEAKVITGTIIPMFEAEHPNIQIKFVGNLATGDVIRNIQALEQGGDVGATIVGIDNLAIGELLYANQLMSLDSIAPSIVPSTMISSMAGIVNYEKQQFNGTYFIPLRGNVPLVFYNKETLGNAGYPSPPATMPELLQAAEAIYKGTGIKPVMFQGRGEDSTPTELFQWFVQFGGNPMLLNDTGDLQAFQYIYNLSQFFTPGYVQGYWGTYDGLANGEYSILYYQWPYVYNLLLDKGMDSSTLGVYPGPAGPVKSAHIIGGDVLAIPKGASDIPALTTFAQFLLSTPTQKHFITDLSWPAVDAAAYQDLPSNITEIYTVIQQGMQNPVFRPPVPWITEWNNIVDQVWTQVIVDHAPYESIQATLNGANQQMYNYLLSNYGSAVAQQYEQGAFGPLF